MAIFKVTFTPSGPYFFGNEKTFKYDNKSNSPKKQSDEQKLYYIKGEDTPSQSTLFGALRYILLPRKGFNKLSEACNINAIGVAGFNMDSNEQQSFGWIKRMSAMFISHGDELFIPTPFDHNCAAEKKEVIEVDGKTRTVCYYTPMKGYTEFKDGNCLDNTALYLSDYKAKEGLASSFMSLKDYHLEKSLFTNDVRVGINLGNSKEGFFKKEYKCLKPGFDFCVFVQLDEAAEKQITTPCLVSIGQGKVPFAVKFKKVSYTEIDEVYTDVKAAIKKEDVSKDRVYCISDMVAVSDLYQDTAFAIVKTRDHRSFSRSFDEAMGKYKKSDVLHRLVKAGSVFIPKSLPQDPIYKPQTARQNNAFTVGYNQISIIKKSEG